MMKRSLFTFLAAAAISAPAIVVPAVVTPAVGEVGASAFLDGPPPAPVYEVVPPARIGYVWAPGYWRWVDERHEEREHGWRHDPGHWDRD